MVLVLRLPYYMHPEKPRVGSPLLLFLHGVGEGFVNRDQIGHSNLLQQGPPKHLATILPDHPLRTSFTLVAPQLPDRETLWSEVIDDVQEILDSCRTEKGKLYIMGFSKGGLGAFQVAKELGADALITIDASPMDFAPEGAVNRWGSLVAECPFWAIHANYAEGERFSKIQRFNELLTLEMHIDGLARLPNTGAQVRSLVQAPDDKKEQVDRHVWVCDQVSTSDMPYRWLLQH